MKNFVQKSFSINIIAPKDLTSGVPFILGCFAAVPVCDAKKGELVTVYTEGVFELNVTGQVNVGDAVYLHADGILSATSQSGVLCGFSLEVSAGGQIKVMLNKSVSLSSTVDLSSYLKTQDFNKMFIAACSDAAVKAAINAAAKP